jgi:hypothetical protein
MNVLFVRARAAEIPAHDRKRLYVCTPDGERTIYVVFRGRRSGGIEITAKHKIKIELTAIFANILRWTDDDYQEDLTNDYVDAIRTLSCIANIPQVEITMSDRFTDAYATGQTPASLALLDRVVIELHALFTTGKVERSSVQLSVEGLSLKSLQRLSEIYGRNSTEVRLQMTNMSYLYSNATELDGEEFQGRRRMSVLNFTTQCKYFDLYLWKRDRPFAVFPAFQFRYAYVRERRLLGLPIRREFAYPPFRTIHNHPHCGYELPFYLDFPEYRTPMWRYVSRVPRLITTLSVFVLTSAREVSRIGRNSDARLLPTELYRKLADFLPGLNKEDRVAYKEFMEIDTT